MNQEEYLEKLVADFGELNGYAEDEKKEFFELLKLLIAQNENDDSLDKIINLIVKEV